MPNDTSIARTAAGLRAWARGLYPLEAAAELLIRAFNGRLLHGPWITDLDDGYTCLDLDHLDEAGVLSSGERHVLAIATSLTSNDHPVALADTLPGLDRDALTLVLAAIAHAGGSHQHSNIVHDRDAGHAHIDGYHPSLHPWPADGRYRESRPPPPGE